MGLIAPLMIAVCCLQASAAARVTGYRVLACAPGYPGSTAQAQPTMDAFAAMLAEVTGPPSPPISARYEPTEAGGLEQLADPQTAVALLPLAFFLKHEREWGLRAVAQVVQAHGTSSERWSLVAAMGKVRDPQDLVGWEVTGIPGYAPHYVGGPILGEWGTLPLSSKVTFASRVVRQLRRAAAGEMVAVLLDQAQTAALDSLPSAGRLEIVTSSPPLTATVLAVVDDRLDDEAIRTLLGGALRVHEIEHFGEVLETLRLIRFEELDVNALDRARTAYRAVE